MQRPHLVRQSGARAQEPGARPGDSRRRYRPGQQTRRERFGHDGGEGEAAALLRRAGARHHLSPDRSGNGHRDYGEPAVEDAQQIRALLDSGPTTEMTLPHLSGPDEILLPADRLPPETAGLLKVHLDRLQARSRDG